MQNEPRVLLLVLKLSIILTLCVIVLGAYTRLSDAGLGCPDWPGCYGHLSVPTSTAEIAKANQLYPHLDVVESKAWPEMIHRYFAGSLGLLVFAITWISLRHNRVGFILPISLSLVVIAQALLGMWTVTLKLMPIVVLAHLFGGFTLLSLLVLLYTKIRLRTAAPAQINEPLQGAIKSLALITLVSVIGQIFLGGWTSANYAALMCTSLPICQGEWTQYLNFKTAFTLIQSGHDNYEFGVLDYASRMTIHISHRIGAIIVAIVVLLFHWQAKRSADPFLRHQSHWLLFLLLIQITLGVSNVLLQLPLPIAVLHNLCGALILITTVRINYVIYVHNKGHNIATSHSIESNIRGTHE
ncbi:heme A synthase [Vibrio sp. F74]|uniref:COX15/CtaA family protein n=1 Tax=Vibrio sp. F74 TaxID=700020 RepID=UPI0035F55775